MVQRTRSVGREGGALAFLMALSVVAATGCGGEVVPAGGTSSGGAGGSGTTGTSSTTASTTSSSTTSGGVTCAAEGDCPSGSVCLWGSGVCVETCTPGSIPPCGQGLDCDGCATSSCPGCKDCVAACVPVAPGQCDDHDDCPKGSLCIYETGACALPCDPATAACPSGLYCDPWATAACPMCQQALAACVPPPPP